MYAITEGLLTLVGPLDDMLGIYVRDTLYSATATEIGIFLLLRLIIT